MTTRSDKKNKPKKLAPEISDEEEARIQAGIAQDPDNQEWTEEDFKRARPAREVVPEIVEAYEKGELRVRGPIDLIEMHDSDNGLKKAGRE